MSFLPARCWMCQEWAGGCTGACQQTPFQVASEPKGCICPPTSEKTCERWDCGRKTPTVTSGTTPIRHPTTGGEE